MLITDSPILITGGAGFIGSCLAKQLVLNAAQNVIVLDKLTYAGNLDSLQEIENHELYSFIAGDIADSDLVADILVQHNPQGIINLAAESHVDRSIDGPAEFVQTNVVGTCNLLDSCFKYWRNQTTDAQAHFRFLHVSTDEVYGDIKLGKRSNEKFSYDPSSPYSASKASADHLVKSFVRTYKIPAIISNCCNNYGPNQFPEKLIPKLIYNIIKI
mgnify:CR=1 FL=1